MLMKMLTLLFSLYLRLCDYTQTLNYFFFFCTIPSSCVYLDGLWRPYIPNFHNNIFHNEHGEALEQVAQRSCGCPSLEVFKASLDGALSNMVQRKVSLSMAGGLD